MFKWKRRDKKQKNKKKFKDYTNNKKSVTLLGELIFRRNENDKSKKNKKRI